MTKLRILQNLFGGDAPGLENLLVVIDVMQESVERPDPLAQAVGHALPFVRRNDARHDVEGNQALLAGILTIDGKSDSDTMKSDLSLAPLARNNFGRTGAQPLGVAAVILAHVAIGSIHFIVGSLHRKSCIQSHRSI